MRRLKKIRGPKDTEVTLTLYSDGDESTHEVTVKRGHYSCEKRTHRR